MSRRNFFQDPQEQEPSLGMDTTSSLQAMQPGYVRSALNCRPNLSGGYVKRGGYAAQLDTPWSTRSITAGIEYKGSGGTRLKLLFGTDGTGTGGRLGYISAGAVTEILTGLSGSARPSLIQYDDQLFFFNGSDAPVVYDGTSTKQMGITPPASAPTSSIAAGGSPGLGAGSYIWAITYYNSVTGAESSPSPLVTGTAAAGNKNTLSFSAGSASTADTIRIYRTYANGQQLYLEGTAAISATSYVSQLADASLTTPQLELDNTRLTTWSGTPKYPAVADRRIFIRTGKNEIRWSKVGQSGAMPESFPVTNVADCAGTYGGGDDVIGISKAGSVPIVLKERSIGKLELVGFPDSSVAAETSFYLYKELTDAVGALSHWAAVEVLGECIFLTKDNIFGTRGEAGDLRALAPTLQTTIRGLGFASSQIQRVSAINDPTLQQVRFQVFLNSNASTPAYTLVGDYRDYPKFKWTIDAPGTNTGTHPGIVAGCYFSALDATTGVSAIFFGGVSNGQVYQLHSGTTDAGSAIYFEIIDRPRGCQNPMADKLWKTGGFYAEGDGTAYNLTISAIYDLSGEEEGVRITSLATGGSLWDNSDWDTATFASTLAPLRKYQPHRKAKFQQLVFRQTSASAPLTLQSWFTAGSLFRVY